MNITAITRYKHGEIYKLLQKLGWSQLELGRRSGLCPTVVGKIINLSRRPNEEQANAIQRAFGEAGEYLDVLEEWPDTFRLEKGFKREETVDVPVGNLLYSKEMLALEFESTAAPKEMVEGLEAAMEDLSPKEKLALEDFMDGRPIHEIEKRIGVCRQQCHNIHAKALRKLRQSSRISKLDCDLADQQIENDRKRAAQHAKEVKEREEKYRKESAEREEKERLRQEKLSKDLQAVRVAHWGVFGRAREVVLQNSAFLGHSYVRSTTGEVMFSGHEEVLKFIQKFVDPEWNEGWAHFIITHPEEANNSASPSPAC